MKGPAAIIILVLLGAALLMPGVGLADRDKEKAATEAALAWLALVDAGEYGPSWDQASALFRGAVAKQQWVAQIKGVRAPLGELKGRLFLSAEYTKALPGAPDGEYVVIQYRAAFANKAEAVETVTPMLDKDGTWRVSGYYIR